MIPRNPNPSTGLLQLNFRPRRQYLLQMRNETSSVASDAADHCAAGGCGAVVRVNGQTLGFGGAQQREWEWLHCWRGNGNLSQGSDALMQLVVLR